MAKTAGGVRTYRQGTSTYQKRFEEVGRLRMSGRYSSVEMGKGGGYVAIEKSPFKHKPEELEAARILADKGYKVTLKNESGMSKTIDGYLFTVSFEQRTPKGNSVFNFKRSLEHALQKKADIAVLYMKGNGHTRQSVEAGIKEFENRHNYRFREMIVVTENGKIHRHKHNK